MSTVIDTADTLPMGSELSEEELEEPRPWYVRVGRFIKAQGNRVMLIIGILLFLLIFFWSTVFVTINAGEVGVLYKRFGGGTQTDRLLGEGIKFVWPWDKLFIYNVRVQELKNELPVLTQEGLTVKLDISIRYHPELEMVGLLHQRVGQDYAIKVVQPEVFSAIRTIMAANTMNVVYSSAQTLIARIVEESLEQVSQKFVRVDEVLVTQVELPESIRQIIEEKMVEKEKAASYEFRMQVAEREAARKVTEANGINTYNTIVNASMTPAVLTWHGIQATKDLALSPNAKTVVIGRSADGLPLILGQ